MTQSKVKAIAMAGNENIGEMLNGRLAMLGVVAALGAYAITGQVIPGFW